MSLLPEVQSYLEELAAQSQEPLHRLSPQQARQQMEAGTALLGERDQVARVDNCSVPGPATDIRLRLYYPQDNRPLPVLVYFHGGGWVLGSIDTHDGLCRAIANLADCIVVSVEYRLAPENRFPAAAEDAYAATRWVYEHADRLGYQGKLAVAGDSAGGNLATVACLMARDRGGPPIDYQMLLYPITDHDLQTDSYREFADGYMLTRDSMQWFWDQYLPAPEERNHPYASPLQAEDVAGLPPAYVLTAAYDPLLDEGEAYAGRLDAAGVPTTLKRFEGTIHGFLRRHKLMDHAQGGLEEIGRELKQNLHASP